MRKLMPIDLHSLNKIEGKTSLRMKSDDPSSMIQSLLKKIFHKIRLIQYSLECSGKDNEFYLNI